MSKNSKMVRKAELKRQFRRASNGAQATSNGPQGPKKTEPKHGKRKSKWQLLAAGVTPRAPKPKTDEAE